MKRLYYFTSAKYGLKAMKNCRLKASDLEETNDLFDFVPYRNEIARNGIDDSFQEFNRWRCEVMMICLSETYKSPLLWGHYGDRGKGICLGFDVKPYDYEYDDILAGGSGVFFKVKYELDKIGPGYNSGVSHSAFRPDWLNYGIVKSKEWEYEKEWRMCRYKEDLEANKEDLISGLYYFPFGNEFMLREVLIGPRFKYEESNLEEEMRNWLDVDKVRYELDMKHRRERLINDYSGIPAEFCSKDKGGGKEEEMKGVVDEIQRLAVGFDPEPEIFGTRLSRTVFEVEKAI